MKPLLKDLKSINLLSPKDWIKFTVRQRIPHFLFTGGSGLILNLTVTGILTELVLGREKYFIAYIIGISINLLYNFLLYAFFAFKAKGKQIQRFLIFIIYSIIMSIIQAISVKILVENIFGVDLYLFVITFVIGFFAIINFIIFKLFLFKNWK